MGGDDGIELTSDLETLQPVEKRIPTADATKRVEPKGVIRPDDLHLFLTEAILREVVDWSNSDTSRELGGVFVGDLYAWQGMPYVEVAGYIRAKHYENTAASFRFTHDSLSAISREKEQRFNDRPTVGWHHTHPGYGIFLSGTDLFSHRSHFPLPWMFALVVDPTAGNLGFFQWKRGQIVPCGFFFVR
jgi:proteasome lid subunit RPN8/RPN11